MTYEEIVSFMKDFRPLEIHTVDGRVLPVPSQGSWMRTAKAVGVGLFENGVPSPGVVMLHPRDIDRIEIVELSRQPTEHTR